MSIDSILSDLSDIKKKESYTLKPLNSPQWKYESLCLLTVETRCSCGSIHHSPEDLFIVRYHPRHGRHMENFALHQHAPQHLPRVKTTHTREVRNCAKCFSTETPREEQLPLAL